MRQQQFIQQHEAQWTLLEAWLETRPGERDATLNAEFPRRYRAVCHHLSLARSRLYSRQLIERLDRLVLRAHQQLYRSRAGLRGEIMFFAAAGFPAVVRREWRLVTLAASLFFGPMLLMGIGQHFSPDLVYTMLDAGQVSEFESMYSPQNAERFGRERESDSDFLMFGYYIRNNTSIGFQTFAGGLLFGLGTLFYLLFNGLLIGAIAGHLTLSGSAVPFWSFVAGHSALELTAIMLSGAAGLRLGLSLVRPGRRSRARSLREGARVAVSIVYGAAAMFVLAAFVEAFWSSIAWIAPTTKYGVGAALWLLVVAYFVLMGRARAT